jgi:hypothetical protein
MALPINKINQREVETIILHGISLKKKKVPGYQLITSKMLKNLPDKWFKLLTYTYNAILRLEYFPCQGDHDIETRKKPKLRCIVQTHQSSTYPLQGSRKILLKRLVPIIDEHQLIPKHQFGFRKGHGTTEQIHRLVNKIYNDFENRHYCSAVSVDISQAFDKVWHICLFYKLKCTLPHPIFSLLKSYLTDRTFFVSYEEAYTKLYPVLSGVLQGSILGPMLYSILTADLPETIQTMIATYADDTTILASQENPTEASRLLQTHLDQ